MNKPKEKLFLGEESVNLNLEDIINLYKQILNNRYYNPLKISGKSKKKEGKCLIENAMSFLGSQTHSQQILHSRIIEGKCINGHVNGCFQSNS